MSQPIPEHIKQMIERNPNAVLTSRGIVLPRHNGFEELLSGIPNADKLYQKEFDEIRKKQKENREVAKVTTHIESKPETPLEPILKVEDAKVGEDGLVHGTATVLSDEKPVEEQQPADAPKETTPEVEVETPTPQETHSLDDAEETSAASEAKVAAEDAEKAVAEAEKENTPKEEAPKEEVKPETAAQKKARERAERKAAKAAEAENSPK